MCLLFNYDELDDNINQFLYNLKVLGTMHPSYKLKTHIRRMSQTK